MEESRTPLDRFVEAALAGQLEEADSVLSSHPELRQEPVAAALLGHDQSLDPEATYAPKDWPALLYVCFSRYHQRPENRTGLLVVAQKLLAEGADPDASYIDAGSPELPETCLYGASGINNHSELVNLLLSYGANAQDGEALYHSAEHRDLQCLRLVLEAGGDPKGTNCLAHMLDYDDAAGLKLVLDHYGPPDEELNNALHHALIRGRSVPHLRLLFEYGAGLSYRRNEITPYLRARLLGEGKAAEFLEGVGADTTMDEAERFTVACMESDDSIPAVSLPTSLQGFLGYAARDGRTDAMRRLLSAGCDPDVRAEWGLTGLHQAGWNGQTEAVRLLLDSGASLSVRDPHHDGTPLNWTVAGAAWNVRPDGDYIGSARAMLERGAADHCSADWILEISKDMPEMQALLLSYLGR